MRFKELEVKTFGPVWVVCPYPTVTLGLEKTLEAQARANDGREGSCSPNGPSSIIYCPSGEEDVASEVRRLRTLVPDASLLIFGLRLDPQLAKTAIRAGARGFIHAGMQPGQIVRALAVVAEGATAIPRGLLEGLLGKAEPQVDLDTLTPRQLEILELVVEGLTNAQIAKRVFLSESTIKQHLRAAYKLLGARNRTEAAKLVRKSAYNGSCNGSSSNGSRRANGAALVKGGVKK
jgi:DNA-binding NarL/FixJ family response regulator